MIINNKDVDINTLIEDVYDDKNMLKMRGNGIYLSDNDIMILERYNINYQKYNSVKSLIFEIEDILNEDSDNLEDLDELSRRLSEINYYNYTNK